MTNTPIEATTKIPVPLVMHPTAAPDDGLGDPDDAAAVDITTTVLVRIRIEELLVEIFRVVLGEIDSVVNQTVGFGVSGSAGVGVGEGVGVSENEGVGVSAGAGVDERVGVLVVTDRTGGRRLEVPVNVMELALAMYGVSLPGECMSS